MNINVIYLLNSGFALELEDRLLVFDYYQDPRNILPGLLPKYSKVYFFATHRHFDHFNPVIKEFAAKVTKYIISFDIKNHGLPADKVVVMNEYSEAQVDDMLIRSYSSTDEGTCFDVEVAGKRIFHAGDFNWWHWKGDTSTNIAFARNGFKKQMKYFKGLHFNLVFFPVDSRLEEFMDLGIKSFAQEVAIDNLVTMHNVGGKPWEVPDVPELKQIKKIFIPINSGDSCQFKL